MRSFRRSKRSLPALEGVVATSLTFLLLSAMAPCTSGGDHPWGWLFHKHSRRKEIPNGPTAGIDGGEWYWMHTPEQEKTVVMGLYNRYCIRCHGVDGRGVWDMPGVPDFTDLRWQNSRTDAEIVRILIEGRGAVMPSFRGTIALDECWGLARYLRSFVPGGEMSKPLLRDQPGQSSPAPAGPPRSAERPSIPAGPLPR
jgi:hypothetical protein